MIALKTKKSLPAKDKRPWVNGLKNIKRRISKKAEDILFLFGIKCWGWVKINLKTALCFCLNIVRIKKNISVHILHGWCLIKWWLFRLKVVCHVSPFSRVLATLSNLIWWNLTQVHRGFPLGRLTVLGIRGMKIYRVEKLISKCGRSGRVNLLFTRSVFR